MTAQEELDLVNTLLRTLAETGIAEWQETGHRTKYWSLKELLDWKDRAQNRVIQESSPIVMPVTEVNW